MSVMNVVMSAVTGMLAISFGIEGARVAKNVPVVSRRVRWGQLRCACVEDCLSPLAVTSHKRFLSWGVKAINFSYCGRNFVFAGSIQHANLSHYGSPV